MISVMWGIIFKDLPMLITSVPGYRSINSRVSGLKWERLATMVLTSLQAGTYSCFGTYAPSCVEKVDVHVLVGFEVFG